MGFSFLLSATPFLEDLEEKGDDYRTLRVNISDVNMKTPKKTSIPKVYIRKSSNSTQTSLCLYTRYHIETQF